MPANVPLTIKQGAVFRFARNWVLALTDGDGELILDEDGNAQPGPDPVPFPDYESARMEIRRAQQDIDGMVSLSSDDDEVSYDPDTGEILIYIPATKTKLLNSKKMWYDLELVPTTGEPDVVCPMQGPIKVIPNYTQEPGEEIVE